MPYQITFRWFDAKKSEVKEQPTAAAAHKLVYGLNRSDARVESIRAPGGYEIHENELERLALAESDPSPPPVPTIG